MDDLPPTFATQSPSVFDSSLPNINKEDVECLKDILPEFSENLKQPDLSSILKFFDSKSEDKEEADRVEELVQAVQDMGLSTNTEQSLSKTLEPETLSLIAHSLPHLKDLDK